MVSTRALVAACAVVWLEVVVEGLLGRAATAVDSPGWPLLVSPEVAVAGAVAGATCAAAAGLRYR